MDAKQVWRAALGELQVSLSPANFETWLRETSLVAVDDHRFSVAVPNGFAKDWLESRYRSLISQTLARIVGYSVQVEFEVRTDTGARTEEAAAQPVRVEPTRVGGEGGASNLNPRYTFGNFIVGSANRLAHAASLSVAERPDVVRRQAVERGQRPRPGEEQLPHVADVEQTRGGADAFVFLQDAVVLHRHRPAGELDHPRPMGHVPVVKRGSQERRHGSFRQGNQAENPRILAQAADAARGRGERKDER